MLNHSRIKDESRGGGYAHIPIFSKAWDNSMKIVKICDILVFLNPWMDAPEDPSLSRIMG